MKSLLVIIVVVLMWTSITFAQLENYDVTLNPNQENIPENHKQYTFKKYMPAIVRSGKQEEILVATNSFAIVDIESEIIIRQQNIKNLSDEVSELEAMRTKILELQKILIK